MRKGTLKNIVIQSVVRIAKQGAKTVVLKGIRNRKSGYDKIPMNLWSVTFEPAVKSHQQNSNQRKYFC